MQARAARSTFIELIAIVPALQAADPVAWDSGKTLREHAPACLCELSYPSSLGAMATFVDDVVLYKL